MEAFLEKEEKAGEKIFPPRPEVFNAFVYCPWENVKVVIIGQDPYHDDRQVRSLCVLRHKQAQGLCFSVNKGIPIPPSLRNIYTEIHSDLGLPIPKHGSLVHWAKQGVLLLNACLTVRAHKANSHKKKGWETFTDNVIKEVSDKKKNVVFLLWGKPAQEKGAVVDTTRHLVLKSAHVANPIQ